MEAAAEGASGGERWPDGGEDTDELSGLRESSSRQHINAQLKCETNFKKAINRFTTDCTAVLTSTMVNIAAHTNQTSFKMSHKHIR